MNNRYLTIALLASLFLPSCHKDENTIKEPKALEKTVEVLATQATFKWTVDWLGKFSSVVEISEYADMSVSRYFGSDAETDNPNFTATAAELRESSKYYYRYVVWNRNYLDNKFLMEVKNFKTKADVPKVKTVEVTDVTRTSAKILAEVTDESGSAVTERGVCWSTDPNPTMDNYHLNNGSGTGIYSIALSGLEAGRTYYVCAYAVNEKGVAYGEQLSFNTGDAVIPTVTTMEITDIDWRTATGGGEVIDDGDATVTERGLCWGASHDPEITGSYCVNGTGVGSYSVDMTDLTAGTTYYVRAYAKNHAGVGYGNEVSFVTKAPELPVVVLEKITGISWNKAICEGNLTSDGGIEVLERGAYFGTSPNPAETGTKVVVSTMESGAFPCVLSDLNSETTYYACVYAINEQGTSYSEDFEFTTLMEGVMSGLFSVSSDRKVYFSKGNLQYQASTELWRFAEHQYDYLGFQNSNISPDYNGWIDLFGWGTSGWYSGAVCYQPWSISGDYYDYYPGGSYSNNLTGDFANADWGVYNAIENGGNEAGLWRTLTSGEWKYVFVMRHTASGMRYTMACVNNVNGVILLPDDWSTSYYSLKTVENTGYNYEAFNSNVISASQWEILEQYGAIFLPAAGYRFESHIVDVAEVGGYWSSSYNNEYYAFYVDYYYNQLNPQNYTSRYGGHSVRLVRSFQ